MMKMIRKRRLQHHTTPTTNNNNAIIAATTCHDDEDDDVGIKNNITKGANHNYHSESCYHCCCFGIFVNVFHIGSILLWIIGILLCTKYLTTSEECDMTWSQRQFLQITNIIPNDTDSKVSTNNNRNYRLYQFFDARDARYHSFTVSNERDQKNDWKTIFLNEPTNMSKSNTTKGEYQRNNKNVDKWCRAINSLGRRTTATKSSLDDDDTKRKTNPTTRRTIVLYIPGHYGNYQQSRSLGAHGLQLTSSGQNEKEYQVLLQLTKQLKQQQQNQRSQDEEGIVLFDVFAIDFREEGSAFHGSILHRQANYIVHVINTLTTSLSSLCNYNDSKTKIIIVAHSIGAISTLLAMTKLQEQEQYKNYDNDVNMNSQNENDFDVRNQISAIITLGSPLLFPILTWSPSIYNVYHRIQQHNNNLLYPPILSISGGLRDEMIPPMACQFVVSNHDHENDVSIKNDTNNTKNTVSSNFISILATDIMKQRQGDMDKMSINSSESSNNILLGMDHRAIVWCHNLLSQIRSIIVTIIVQSADDSNNDGKDERIDENNHNNGESYEKKKTSHSSSNTVRRSTNYQYYSTLIRSVRQQLLNLSNNNSSYHYNSQEEQRQLQSKDNNNWNDSFDYHRSVQNSRQKLQKKYGYIQSLLMETGLLYNSDILVMMYTCFGIWYYFMERFSLDVSKCIPRRSARIVLNHWIPPLIFALAQYCAMIVQSRKQSTTLHSPHRSSSAPLLSILILAFVADSIFRFLRFAMNGLVRGRCHFIRQSSLQSTNTGNTLRQTFVILLKCIAVWIPLWVVLLLILPKPNHFWFIEPKCCFALLSFLTIYSLSTYLIARVPGTYYLSSNKASNSESHTPSLVQSRCVVWFGQQIQYTIWILPTFVILCFGDLIIIPMGLGVSSSVLLSPIVIWCLPVCVKVLYSHHVLCVYGESVRCGMTTFRPFSRRICIHLIVDSLILTGAILGCWNAMMSLRGTWNSTQEYHPIMKLILFVTYIDTYKMFEFVYFKQIA